jgi:hypothetical protein
MKLNMKWAWGNLEQILNSGNAFMVDFQIRNSDEIRLIFLVVKHSDGRTDGRTDILVYSAVYLFCFKKVVITHYNNKK